MNKIKSKMIGAFLIAFGITTAILSGCGELMIVFGGVGLCAVFGGDFID